MGRGRGTRGVPRSNLIPFLAIVAILGVLALGAVMQGNDFSELPRVFEPILIGLKSLLGLL